MLHLSISDTKLIDEVNRFFEGGPGRGLVDIHEPGHWYGGTKGFEAQVWIAACNHLNLRAFYEHIRKLPWRRPECLQLIVKDQEDFVFRAIQVFPDAFNLEQNQQIKDFPGPWPHPSLVALSLGGLPSLGMAAAQSVAPPDGQSPPVS